MLGFLYLALIIGWMLIVIILKCKKILAPHLMYYREQEIIGSYIYSGKDSHLQYSLVGRKERSNFVMLFIVRKMLIFNGRSDRNPTVHVIQLDEEDLHCQSGRHSIIGENIETYPAEVLTNPGYEHDDDIMLNAPPPSYDEVMRQPATYPKVQDLKNI